MLGFYKFISRREWPWRLWLAVAEEIVKAKGGGQRCALSVMSIGRDRQMGMLQVLSICSIPICSLRTHDFNNSYFDDGSYL